MACMHIRWMLFCSSIDIISDWSKSHDKAPAGINSIAVGEKVSLQVAEIAGEGKKRSRFRGRNKRGWHPSLAEQAVSPDEKSIDSGQFKQVTNVSKLINAMMGYNQQSPCTL